MFRPKFVYKQDLGTLRASLNHATNASRQIARFCLYFSVWVRSFLVFLVRFLLFFLSCSSWLMEFSSGAFLMRLHLRFLLKFLIVLFLLLPVGLSWRPHFELPLEVCNCAASSFRLFLLVLPLVFFLFFVFFSW